MLSNFVINEIAEMLYGISCPLELCAVELICLCVVA